ncbi:MAG: methylenetetrahydrofolate reductase C-terminal domain-containing protein [Candidatus Schekmanbacteria bacterium]|nr:methylenetetrahydrofolate reductase C-terminal domain-containing protein [Candidatus Schekmanbacteria bacterium]
MIITKPKPMAQVMRCLAGIQRVFLVGCGECATTCMTGGAEQIQEMKAKLEAEGKEVVGSFVGESDCHILDMKRQVRLNKEAADKAEAFLVLSCGAGVQTFSEILDKPVYAANDTMFLGNIQRFGVFAERCSLCGDCVLNETGGICPVTNCPKGLLNGPCGGMNKGMCEVNQERECAWVMIYKRLLLLNQLDKMKTPLAAKNYATSNKPHSLTLERKKGGAA